ncbi:MAG: hypothetical protein AAFP69_22440, partial [Planctomycetota bacterium]
MASVIRPIDRLENDTVRERVSRARSALWWFEVTRAVLAILIGGLALVLAWVLIDHWIYAAGVPMRITAFVGLVAGCLYTLLMFFLPIVRGRISMDYAAASLERDIPSIGHALSSYVSLAGNSDPPAALEGDAGKQQRVAGLVLQSMGVVAAGRLRESDVDMPSEATQGMRWWLLAIACVAMFAIYGVMSPKSTMASVARLVMPTADIAAPTRVQIRDVMPGDLRQLAGRAIQFSARIDGMRRDEIAAVQIVSKNGMSEGLPMQWDDSSNAMLAPWTVDSSIEYRIVAGDAVSDTYRIDRIDVPVANLERIEYRPPAYTRRPIRTSRQGDVSEIEGTVAVIHSRFNRPMQSASLQLNPIRVAGKFQSTAGTRPMRISDEGMRGHASIPLIADSRLSNGAVAIRSYQVRIFDAEKVANPDPLQHSWNVIADLPPEISIVTPRESPKQIPVSSQQLFEVHAMDPDYGLTEIQIRVSVSGQAPKLITIW